MVTGSVAAAIYGEPRLTQDVDLVLKLPGEHPSALVEGFPALVYYVPPIEVLAEEARRSRGGHFNLMHLESGLRADCYLAGAQPLAEWGLGTRRVVQVGDDRIWLAAPEYVIVSKLSYYGAGGGEKHLDDIAGMLRVSASTIDRDAIVDWAAKLRLEHAWRAAMDRFEALPGR